MRLSPAQHRILAEFARQRGLSEYAMLARVVDQGLIALVQGTGSAIDTREIVTELAAVGTHVIVLEHMLDRTLFTACAAYCYARSAASGAGKSDEVLTQEIHAAYDRQRRLAQEHRS
ncbi:MULTISPECIES: hypothetical protein [Sphingobium]|uniref:hypothetical protein n=1 Tax=Sphingobium TaxID=165695 RepID=UPI001F0E319E|nr:MULTISPECIES: hypothetical protein [Sphingobium]